MSIEATKTLLLIQAGRDQAVELISDTIKNSRDDEHMMDRIFILRWLAIHILAQEAFNNYTQDGIGLTDSLAWLGEDFRAECQALSECQSPPRYLTPGDPPR